ncbi:MAG TPA: GspE/PulE family protein [Gemmatimonadales bacterium]|nr:GspE/PulE family protein [Gemmatimonadales bacterium]
MKTRLSVVEEFAAEYLEYHGVLPLEVHDGRLLVAVSGTPAEEVLEDLSATFDLPLELLPSGQSELLDAIKAAFDASPEPQELADLTAGFEAQVRDADPLAADTRDLATQPPVIRFVNRLLRDAAEVGASDVHLDSRRGDLELRFRLDGVLHPVGAPPPGLRAAIVSRIKLLAELDIAERRVPQDGRIRLRLEDRELDLRVSTVPTLHGESVVLRLLDRGGRPVTLDELGMGPGLLDCFHRLAKRSHGVVLATGPTGSGKTTTLYAALGLRSAGTEKVITVEDPVEYHLPGVTQVPVHAKAGVTFGAALRSILRQDPDVLMVGEMRDAETAGIAIRAAMTGHLVFSTLHTNDAVSAVTRLVDLGSEPYMIAASLEGVLAQRLVRRNCVECRERYRPDPMLVAAVAGHPVDAFEAERGRGCEACRGTGYKGRVGLFELLVVSDEIRHHLVHDDLDLGTLRRIATSQGMAALREDAWTKVQTGITTVEEVLRVLQG